jgi:hypothetical protein
MKAARAATAAGSALSEKYGELEEPVRVRNGFGNACTSQVHRGTQGRQDQPWEASGKGKELRGIEINTTQQCACVAGKPNTVAVKRCILGYD